MATKKHYSLVIVLIVILFSVTGWVSGWVSAYSPDYYLQIQKNIELFGRVYQEVAKNYVEEVEPATFMRAGIRGMLATLDPYTVLLEKDDDEELQIMSSGKYGGLGMRIGLRGNYPTVVEPPFDGTPALKAGIREGDQIIEVDSSSTKGLSTAEVASMLRGEIGSEVFLTIRREGEDQTIDFRLIRAEIVVTDVAYSGLLDGNVGYIRLSNFSLNAGKDVENAIRELKREGMQKLILDLRSNPGGLLETAVSVSENFIDKGKLIVSTDGRFSGASKEYHASKTAILEGMPLAILVNEYSASASEIVAGTVQDHDRGLIIGRETFGKGLVQTVVRITGEASLKITTAKYLLPSGRSIQDPDKFLQHPDEIVYNYEQAVDEGDALLQKKDKESKGKAYSTANGREVYSSSGVKPDVIVDEKPLTSYEIELLRKTMPFQFAVVYAAKHPELQRDFAVTDEMVNEFTRFLAENQFEYTSDAEMTLDRLEEIAEERQFLATISSSYNELRQLVTEQKKVEFEQSRDFIKHQLKQEISAKLWGSRAEVEATVDYDPVVQEAFSLLADPVQYQALLQTDKHKKE